jgi:hypothetical protein
MSNALNTNNTKKFNEDEINEAKESLKLLKMKMGNNFGSMSSGKVNNFDQGPQFGVQTMNNGNTGNTGNYRKPFQPNFDQPKQISKITNYDESNNKRISSIVTKPQTQPTNSVNQKGRKFETKRKEKEEYLQVEKPKFDYEEVEDNRPAIAGVGKEDDNNDEEEYLSYIYYRLDEYPEDGDEENRIECPTCGRRFREEALPKHAKVCKKVFVNKRKAFDTKKQRILDSEHASILRQKEIEEKKTKNKVGAGGGKMGSNTNVANTIQGTKKPKWLKQSEELRAIIKDGNNTTSNFTNSKF